MLKSLPEAVLRRAVRLQLAWRRHAAFEAPTTTSRIGSVPQRSAR